MYKSLRTGGACVSVGDEPPPAKPRFAQTDQVRDVKAREAGVIDTPRKRLSQRRVHRVTPSSSGRSTPESPPIRSRSLPSAAATWLFTVPTEQPNNSAVSASDRPS
jgi:hypothetical protein